MQGLQFLCIWKNQPRGPRAAYQPGCCPRTTEVRFPLHPLRMPLPVKQICSDGFAISPGLARQGAWGPPGGARPLLPRQQRCFLAPPGSLSSWQWALEQYRLIIPPGPPPPHPSVAGIQEQILTYTELKRRKVPGWKPDFKGIN